MIVLLISFLGEWAVFCKYETTREAQDGLSYWQERISWSLKLGAITGRCGNQLLIG